MNCFLLRELGVLGFCDNVHASVISLGFSHCPSSFLVSLACWLFILSAVTSWWLYGWGSFNQHTCVSQAGRKRMRKWLPSKRFPSRDSSPGCNRGQDNECLRNGIQWPQWSAANQNPKTVGGHVARQPNPGFYGQGSGETHWRTGSSVSPWPTTPHV